MKRLFSLALAALALSAFTAGSANAQNSLSFAQFSKSGAVAGTQFTFVNNGLTGAAAELTGTATQAAVKFSFLNSPFLVNAGLAGEIVNATLDFSVSAKGIAVDTSGQITQPTLVGTMLFKYSGPNTTINGTQFFTGDTLLEVVFGSSRLFGSDGGSGATLNATRPGDLVTFESDSDFFSLDAITDENLGIGFSGVTGGLTISGTNDLVDSFMADGAGTFAATAVPEPASLAMAGLGLLGIALVARRRLVK